MIKFSNKHFILNSTLFLRNQSKQLQWQHQTVKGRRSHIEEHSVQYRHGYRAEEGSEAHRHSDHQEDQEARHPLLPHPQKLGFFPWSRAFRFHPISFYSCLLKEKKSAQSILSLDLVHEKNFGYQVAHHSNTFLFTY